MTKYLLVICLGVLLTAGCSSQPSNHGVAPQSAVSSSPVASAADANRAANQLVLEKGLNWGTPARTIWQKEYNRFLVIYATPGQERLNVGDRGVFVETNGVARLMPQL